MWKQPSSVNLCTYISLQSEAETSSCRNKKKNTFLTEGGLKSTTAAPGKQVLSCESKKSLSHWLLHVKVNAMPFCLKVSLKDKFTEKIELQSLSTHPQSRWKCG